MRKRPSKTAKYYDANGHFNRSQWARDSVRFVVGSNGKKRLATKQERDSGLTLSFIEHDRYSDNSTSFTIVGQQYSWKKISKILEEEPEQKDKFKVSKRFLKEGLDEETQKKIYDTFVQANKKGNAISITTQGLIHPRFSLRFGGVSKEQLIRRLEAARKVLADNYLKKLAEQERDRFLENLRDWFELPEFEVFKEIVEHTNEEEFLNFLKDSDWQYLSYAIDSIATQEGYTVAANKLRNMIADYATWTSPLDENVYY